MRKTFALCFALLLIILPVAAAAAPNSGGTPGLSEENYLEFVRQEAGIELSSSARVAIEQSAAKEPGRSEAFLTITEQMSPTLIRKTIVSPYEETKQGLALMSPDRYIDVIAPVVARGGEVYDTNYGFNGLVLYLNCYYMREYGPYYENCYRFVSLYAVETAGVGPVTNFSFTAEAGGRFVTMNPYVRVVEDVQYTDLMTVGTMNIGTQYSKTLNSIAPYYIDTGYCQLSAYANLWWEGTYNGQFFESGHGLNTGKR